MAYYERSEPYFDYDDYRSDSRRNSNSFSEEVNGAKRKKTNWGGRGRGGNRQYNRSGGNRNVSPRGGGNRNVSPRNATIDTPLFPEPKRTPPVARRAPQPQVDARKRGRERINSYRSNPKPYFDMKEMPDFVEPEHSGPTWHWDNYMRDCKNWQDKHKLAYYQSRCTALEFENQMLFEQINQLIKENVVLASERGRTPTMIVPDIPGLAPQPKQSTDNKDKGKGSQPGQETGDSAPGSDIELVLSEDLVKHLETNIRNKLTIKQEKLAKEKVTAEAKPGSKDTGPKGPGQTRKEELEQLYGKNSNLIHGLETSLQLNFNRNCDTFKPELYPAAPFNSQTAVA